MGCGIFADMHTRLRLVAPLVLLASLPLIGCSPDQHASTATSSTVLPAPTVPGTERFEIYVADQEAPCTGVGQQFCLQVRRDPNASWELHYGGIEGFEFQSGYKYHLLIEQKPWDNPPADAPSVKWILVRQLSKEPVGTP